LASLPPRPDEMTPEIEAKVLTSHAQLVSAPLEPPRPSFLSGSDKLDGPKSEPPDEHDLPGLYNFNIGSSSSLSSSSTTVSTDPKGSTDVSIAEMSPSELLKLHANFDSRLQPFWSSVVTDGTVCVSLYPSTSSGQADRRHGAIAIAELPLSDQGYFGHIFRISYESLCTHPGGLRIAFGDRLMEHTIVAIAELLSPVPQVETTRIARPLSGSYAPPTQSQLHYVAPGTQMTIPLADARVRVISDIDDTIKISNIPHGPRAVFRNVFVRNLDELAVPGMPEWYTSLSRRGVRFHYVVIRFSSVSDDQGCPI
jgi:Phosphatidate phosphatase APP1, catalytic domain